jgi:hypothetical protein
VVADVHRRFAVDGDDAIETSNWDENIAINRNGIHLAIEARPVIVSTDTLPLFMSNMKQMNYSGHSIRLLKPKEEFDIDRTNAVPLPIQMSGSSWFDALCRTDRRTMIPAEASIVPPGASTEPCTG